MASYKVSVFFFFVFALLSLTAESLDSHRRDLNIIQDSPEDTTSPHEVKERGAKVNQNFAPGELKKLINSPKRTCKGQKMESCVLDVPKVIKRVNKNDIEVIR